MAGTFWCLVDTCLLVASFHSGCECCYCYCVALLSELVLTWVLGLVWDYYVLCHAFAACLPGGWGGVGAGWVLSPRSALLWVPWSFHSCNCFVGLRYRWILAGSWGGVEVHSWGLSFFAFVGICCRRFLLVRPSAPSVVVGVLHVGGMWFAPGGGSSVK